MKVAVLATVPLLAIGLSARAAAPQIAMEEFMVPSVEAGIQLYVRNKHPAGMKAVQGERIVLFVHGATYPAETAFDLPLNGLP